MIHALLAEAAPQGQNSMDVWIPAIAVLLGVVIAGLINFFTSFFLARQRSEHDDRLDKRKHLIAKLEEAVKAVHSHFLSANTAYMEFAKASLVPDNDVKVTASLQTYARLIKADGPILAMLIEFYFPELNPQIEYLNKAEADFSKQLQEGINAYVAIKVQKPLMKSVQKNVKSELKKVAEAVESLQQGFAAIAKKQGISSSV